MKVEIHFQRHHVAIFVSLQELVRVHKCLLLEIQDSVHHRSAQNLYQIFITFKERFAFFFKNMDFIPTVNAAVNA